VTQLYFKGDPHAAGDALYRPSLSVETNTVKTAAGAYEVASFDIVLAPR